MPIIPKVCSINFKIITMFIKLCKTRKTEYYAYKLNKAVNKTI